MLVVLAAAPACGVLLGASSDPDVVPTDAAADTATSIPGDGASPEAAGPDDAADEDSPPADNEARTRYVFLLGEDITGNLGGVTGADALCQADADANPPLFGGRTFKAWLSDDAQAAPDRFVHHGSGPYIHPSDRATNVANDFGDFVEGSLRSGFNKGPAGQTIGGVTAFTGTTSTGAKAQFNCSNWTSSASLGVNGWIGSPDNVDGKWTDLGYAACNASVGPTRIYCIEDD